MNLYRRQFRRLAELDKAIRSGRYPNCSSFAKAYEGVSRRTVARDIELLKEMGAPLEFDPVKNGYHYTDRSWQMPAITLSEGELLQLFLAERMAAQYRGTPIARTLAAVFEKLSAALPSDVSLDPAYLGSHFSFHPTPSRPISETIWDSALKALRGGWVLRITYSRPDWTKPLEREIEPVHLASIAGEWHLVAFEHGEKEPKQYALSRVKSAKVLKKEFEPHDFDPGKFFEGRFARFVPRGGKAHKVEIRFSSEAAGWVLEREWHPKQKVRRHRDGSATLSFPAPSLFEAKMWVLRWGAEAEVVGPKELREMVGREARALAKQYRGVGSRHGGGA